MSIKKPTKDLDLEKELEDVNEEELNDDISDEELLNEDLDDPTLDHIDDLLSKKPASSPKAAAKSQNGKNGGTALPSKQTSATPTKISLNPTPKAPPTKKLTITKDMVKEITVFMVKKAQVYDEIPFQTILRKLPAAWGLTEQALIDVLEIIIEKGVIAAKLTANSVKYTNPALVSEKLKEKR